MSETCGNAVLDGDRLILKQSPPLGPATLLGYCQSGYRLAVGTHNQVYTWLPQSWCGMVHPYVTSIGHKLLSGCRGYQLAPVSRVVATIAEGCQVKMGLIDNRIDQPHTTLQHTAEVAAIALAADGRILASACAGRNSVVTVWDVQRETIKRVMVPDYWAPLMAISPDGCYLAQAGESGTVKVWDIRSGTHRIFDVDNAASIRSLAISLDGGLVVAGTDQGWVGLADLGRPYPSSHAGQAWIRWQRCHHDGPVTSLEFALDGQSVFSGGEDGQIIQIDASGRKLASIVPQAGTRVISIVPLPTHGSLIVTRASGLGYEVAPQAIAP